MKTQEEKDKKTLPLVKDYSVFTPNGSLATYAQYLNWDKD